MMTHSAQHAHPPLFLQGAIDIEVCEMIAALADAQTVTLHGYDFTVGTLLGYPTVVALTSVGMVNAAASTAIGLTAFAPFAVINQGMAGGHDETLHRGDIVLGAQTAYINNYRSTWTGAGEGIDASQWASNTIRVVMDGEVRPVKSLAADQALLDAACSTAGSYKRARVVQGVIGSGDMWNRELDRIALIRGEHGTSCEEMETFAVAQVCSAFAVPFLGIRILSNHEVHREEYDMNTAIDCQHFVLDVARTVISQRTE